MTRRETHRRDEPRAAVPAIPDRADGRRDPGGARWPTDAKRAHPSTLARTIAATLLVKLCVVLAMRLFLFDGDHRPVIDDSVMERRLTLPTPPPH